MLKENYRFNVIGGPLDCVIKKKKHFLWLCRADVNAVDQFNWTPLHHACHAGHVAITIMLVQSGAVVDAVAMNGATPLMRAIESCRFSCVEYLIKSGANVMAKNKRGAGSDIEILFWLVLIYYCSKVY